MASIEFLTSGSIDDMIFSKEKLSRAGNADISSPGVVFPLRLNPLMSDGLGVSESLEAERTRTKPSGRESEADLADLDLEDCCWEESLPAKGLSAERRPTLGVTRGFESVDVDTVLRVAVDELEFLPPPPARPCIVGAAIGVSGGALEERSCISDSAMAVPKLGYDRPCIGLRQSHAESPVLECKRAETNGACEWGDAGCAGTGKAMIDSGSMTVLAKSARAVNVGDSSQPIVTAHEDNDTNADPARSNRRHPRKEHLHWSAMVEAPRAETNAVWHPTLPQP